jgi:oligopeptide/dipeptide ABC transporter ATP-binding protein
MNSSDIYPILLDVPFIPQSALPSPTNPPAGCYLNTRSPVAKEICTQENPQYREIKGKQRVACHFAEDYL